VICLSNDSVLGHLRHGIATIMIGFGLFLTTSVARGQNQAELAGPVPIDAQQIAEVMNDEPAADPTAPTGIDLLTLGARGGAFMIPIALMSLLVIALAVERMLTLRKGKVMPKALVDDLNELLEPIERFDPGDAYEACADRPSPTGRVVTAMLMRTGQSLADIERAASETIEREVDQASSPIRWLTLAAAATPLMGLLGTVWGMIVAFHESTTLTADRSRSEQLSEGIYTALVTTLAGLVVAIPAAILALYLENRLAKLFHKLEQLTFDIAPALAQFCGRKRMDANGHLHAMETPLPPPVNDAATPPGPSTRQAKRNNPGKPKRAI
jgi:biopolymer transport protein ExbB